MIYKKYILSQLAQIFGLITFVITAIVVLSQFLKFINQYLSKGFDLSSIVYLLILILPPLIVYVAPITIFCSIYYVYNKLLSDNEIVIFETSGISRYKLALPAITFAAIITISCYLITIFVTPYFKREMQESQTLFRESYIASMLEEKVFNNLSKDLTIYVDEQQTDGSLRGVIVYDQRGKTPAIITSQIAKIIPKPDALLIELYKGNRQTLNEEQQLETLFFDSSIINLNYNKIEGIEHIYSPEEMYIHELISKITTGVEGNVIRYELHQRLSWPLLNLSLASISLLSVLSIGYNRQRKFKQAIIGGTVAAIVVLFDFILTSKSESSYLFAAALYAYLIYVTIQALYWLNQKSEGRKMPYEALSKHLPFMK